MEDGGGFLVRNEYDGKVYTVEGDWAVKVTGKKHLLILNPGIFHATYSPLIDVVRTTYNDSLSIDLMNSLAREENLKNRIQELMGENEAIAIHNGSLFKKFA